MRKAHSFRLRINFLLSPRRWCRPYTSRVLFGVVPSFIFWMKRGRSCDEEGEEDGEQQHQEEEEESEGKESAQGEESKKNKKEEEQIHHSGNIIHRQGSNINGEMTEKVILSPFFLVRNSFHLFLWDINLDVDLLIRDVILFPVSPQYGQ